MPLITLKLVGEKTTEQKRALVKDITEVTSKHLNVPPQAIMVDIVEYEKQNFGIGGELFADR